MHKWQVGMHVQMLEALCVHTSMAAHLLSCAVGSAAHTYELAVLEDASGCVRASWSLRCGCMSLMCLQCHCPAGRCGRAWPQISPCSTGFRAGIRGLQGCSKLVQDPGNWDWPAACTHLGQPGTAGNCLRRYCLHPSGPPPRAGVFLGYLKWSFPACSVLAGPHQIFWAK